jgi:hypothetical protein
MIRSVRHHLFVIPLVALAACGGAEPPVDEAQTPGDAPANPEVRSTDAPTDAPTAPPEANVRIMEPQDGAELEGPEVRVRLEASGFEVTAAGDTTAFTGHHHLYLDHDLTDPDQPVPTIPGAVIHMGDGGSEFVFEGVEPGEHRLIAVVADGVHVPLRPWVVDTVHFRVR